MSNYQASNRNASNVVRSDSTSTPPWHQAPPLPVTNYELPASAITPPPPSPHQVPPRHNQPNKDFTWIIPIGAVFLFVQHHYGHLQFRQAQDLGFSAGAYTVLLLFWCIRLFDQAPQGSATRMKLRVVLSVLAALPTLVLSWKVSNDVPWHVSLLIWQMAMATFLAGLYLLFMPDSEDNKN